jgi:hypothetical protein
MGSSFFRSEDKDHGTALLTLLPACLVLMAGCSQAPPWQPAVMTVTIEEVFPTNGASASDSVVARILEEIPHARGRAVVRTAITQIEQNGGVPYKTGDAVYVVPVHPVDVHAGAEARLVCGEHVTEYTIGGHWVIVLDGALYARQEH